MDPTENQEGLPPDFNPLGSQAAEDTRPVAFLPVKVDKTGKRGEIEHSHVSGTHGLAMWVPTSELAELPEADNSELATKLEAAQDQAVKLNLDKDELEKEVKQLKADNSELATKLEAADVANKELRSQLDKSLKAAPETKDVKKPENSK